MKQLLVFAICCAPALAAVSGTVVNRSTGKPEAGATVGYYNLGQNGPELAEEVKADAQGNFTFNRNPAGPALLQMTFDGVTYSRMVTPGPVTSGMALDVYNASTQPGGAKVSKHMLLFQPSGNQMAVNETYLIENGGNTTWNNPGAGTVRLYLPAAANGQAQVNATPPGGLPLEAGLVKTSAPDVFGIDFAVKPGETRVDVTYTVPYTAGAPYEGKIVSQDENTYLIAPNGVTMAGDHLNDLGSEPKSQAHIYGLSGTAYKIALIGTPVPSPQDASAASDSGGSGDDGSPQIEEVLPHVFGPVAQFQLGSTTVTIRSAEIIIALALGILALGFAILYRAPGQSAQLKERNERGRG